MIPSINQSMMMSNADTESHGNWLRSVSLFSSTRGPSLQCGRKTNQYTQGWYVKGTDGPGVHNTINTIVDNINKTLIVTYSIYSIKWNDRLYIYYQNLRPTLSPSFSKIVSLVPLGAPVNQSLPNRLIHKNVIAEMLSTLLIFVASFSRGCDVFHERKGL